MDFFVMVFMADPSLSGSIAFPAQPDYVSMPHIPLGMEEGYHARVRRFYAHIKSFAAENKLLAQLYRCSYLELNAKTLNQLLKLTESTKLEVIEAERIAEQSIGSPMHTQDARHVAAFKLLYKIYYNVAEIWELSIQEPNCERSLHTVIHSIRTTIALEHPCIDFDALIDLCLMKVGELSEMLEDTTVDTNELGIRFIVTEGLALTLALEAGNVGLNQHASLDPDSENYFANFIDTAKRAETATDLLNIQLINRPSILHYTSAATPESTEEGSNWIVDSDFDSDSDSDSNSDSSVEEEEENQPHFEQAYNFDEALVGELQKLILDGTRYVAPNIRVPIRNQADFFGGLVAFLTSTPFLEYGRFNETQAVHTTKAIFTQLSYVAKRGTRVNDLTLMEILTGIVYFITDAITDFYYDEAKHTARSVVKNIDWSLPTGDSDDEGEINQEDILYDKLVNLIRQISPRERTHPAIIVSPDTLEAVLQTFGISITMGF